MGAKDMIPQQFRQSILDSGMAPVIPPRPLRKEPGEYDRTLYRERNLVGCFTNNLKQFRRAFSQYEKPDTGYLAFPFSQAPYWAAVKCQQNLASRLLTGRKAKRITNSFVPSFYSISP